MKEKDRIENAVILYAPGEEPANIRKRIPGNCLQSTITTCIPLTSIPVCG